MGRFEFHGDFRGIGTSLQCGQAFRWRVYGHVAIGVISLQDSASICAVAWDDCNLKVAVDKTSGISEEYLRKYFGISEISEWERLYNELPEYDWMPASTREVCIQAIESSPALRLLCQEPWETLVTFIISQQNQVGRIAKTVESLAARFGEPLTLGVLEGFSFPTAKRLSEVSLEELSEMGLGYRAEYIYAAAQWCAQQPKWLQQLGDLDTLELKRQLETLKGVGQKISSCVALFGYGRHEEFPLDVWMNRVVAQVFQGRNPQAKLGNLAGLLQQCLYIYARTEKI